MFCIVIVTCNIYLVVNVDFFLLILALGTSILKQRYHSSKVYKLQNAVLVLHRIR